MFIKICGLTSVKDALLAAKFGADAVGLIFAPSVRRVEYETARDIVCHLPEEVMAVGVFRNEAPEKVLELANRLGLKAVQLHGTETPSQTRWISRRLPMVFKAFSIDDPELMNEQDYGSHRLLVDSKIPGSGECFDWSLLESRVGHRRYVLAGGLGPQNVYSAIERLGPWGVDVASGVEAESGVKDPVALQKFITAARNAYDDCHDRIDDGRTPQG